MTGAQQMNSKKQDVIDTAAAVYLAALTKNGPEILSIQPHLDLPEKDLHELAFKSIPMSSKDGDFVSVSLEPYQATCLVNQVPPFKESQDQRDTFVSFGLLLNENTNPIPYRNILRRISSICKENSLMTYPMLKEIGTKLFKSMIITQETTFSFEIKKGVSIEFTFSDELEKWLEKNGGKPVDSPMKRSCQFVGVISCEEALEREKSSFVLDKTVLRIICQEGPVTLDDLRKKTLPLESALGIKIDLDMIQEVCSRYVKDGIIKVLEE